MNTHALRRIEALRMTMDAELKVYEFISMVALYHMEKADITRALLRLILVDDGELTGSKLLMLDTPRR
jgi:hypothetical protein